MDEGHESYTAILGQILPYFFVEIKGLHTNSTQLLLEDLFGTPKSADFLSAPLALTGHT